MGLDSLILLSFFFYCHKLPDYVCIKHYLSVCLLWQCCLEKLLSLSLLMFTPQCETVEVNMRSGFCCHLGEQCHPLVWCNIRCNNSSIILSFRPQSHQCSEHKKMSQTIIRAYAIQYNTTCAIDCNKTAILALWCKIQYVQYNTLVQLHTSLFYFHFGTLFLLEYFIFYLFHSCTNFDILIFYLSIYLSKIDR